MTGYSLYMFYMILNQIFLTYVKYNKVQSQGIFIYICFNSIFTFHNNLFFNEILQKKRDIICEEINHLQHYNNYFQLGVSAILFSDTFKVYWEWIKLKGYSCILNFASIFTLCTVQNQLKINTFILEKFLDGDNMI